MNNAEIVLKQLHARKSMRVYEPIPVEPEKKRAILEAALQAPTAGNMTLFSILDITDPALKERLSVTCDNQPFIATAPLVLVFLADYSRWHQLFRADCENTRAPQEGDLLLAFSDTLIAAQNAVVAADALGLGSCYIGDILERFEIHRELFSLPDYVFPAAMLCIGYPTQQQKDRKKPPRMRVEDIVYENGYAVQDNAAMIQRRQELSGEAYARWLTAYRKRKWDSDFSAEMSRSAAEIIRAWKKA